MKSFSGGSSSKWGCGICRSSPSFPSDMLSTKAPKVTSRDLNQWKVVK